MAQTYVMAFIVCIQLEITCFLHQIFHFIFIEDTRLIFSICIVASGQYPPYHSSLTNLSTCYRHNIVNNSNYNIHCDISFTQLLLFNGWILQNYVAFEISETIESYKQ